MKQLFPSGQRDAIVRDDESGYRDCYRDGCGDTLPRTRPRKCRKCHRKCHRSPHPLPPPLKSRCDGFRAHKLSLLWLSRSTYCIRFYMFLNYHWEASDYESIPILEMPHHATPHIHSMGQESAPAAESLKRLDDAGRQEVGEGC